MTDDEDNSVTIPAEPPKIVSLTPAATETLFALGLGDRLVGKVEDFSLYPPEAARRPRRRQVRFRRRREDRRPGHRSRDRRRQQLQPARGDREAALARCPDLVVFAPDVAGALKDIELVGRAVGRPDEASAVNASIEQAFDDVAAATAGKAPVRTFYELDASAGYFGPAPDYFGTEMIKVAGGDPLTSGTDGVYQIEAEQILAFDPEVVLLGDAAYGVTPEQVAARPGWDTLTAVKNGDVRPIDDVIVTRPGPRLAEGIRALAVAINPDLVLPSPAP